VDKHDIKNCIEEFINKHMLTEARSLLEEYKKLFGNEENIASMEAIVNMYEEKYEEALNCIRTGLELNIFSSDLYYTMGNIYELKMEYDRAYLCYEQGEFLCTVEENKGVIKDSINNLINNQDIKVRKTSIVILTYNNLDYTQVCLNSIKNYNEKDTYEIIIVDNNSNDGTREWLNDQQDLKIILNNENRGFPAGCNQGIEVSEKDNEIFLLNNDTVIMPNSIFNMRMGLYSKENIGAVGAVSNSVSYFQQVDVKYDDFNEYLKFSIRNNISNEESYEERLKLVGFAMLIKRDALSKVGLLDERFTPGNFEDDDLSLRLVNEDYKLLLCKDSYIHHFGSISFNKKGNNYGKLLKTNEGKFENKWGFNAREIFSIYPYCEKYINSEKNIIELTCGAGSNLLNIKQKFKNINIYGYDKNEKLENIISKNIIKVKEEEFNNYTNYFDAVIISDFQEILESQDILDNARALLNDNFRNLIIIADKYRYNNVNLDEDILKEIDSRITNKLFKIVDVQLFKGENNEIVQAYVNYIKLSIDEIISVTKLAIEDGNIEKARKNLELLNSSDLKPNIEELEVQFYEMKKNLSEIKFLLRRWEFNIGEVTDEEITEIILKNTVEDRNVIKIVEKYIINKVLVLNKIAIVFFTIGKNESILPYLEAAYSINPRDHDTLYNLSYVLNWLGEKEIALEYIEKIEDKNQAVLDLIDNIKGV